MKENLVIVESPAKAKTIEKFLGEDYKVVSSYGHIRDLKKRSFSIDVNTFAPQYEVPTDKKSVVDNLKKLSKEAKTVSRYRLEPGKCPAGPSGIGPYRRFQAQPCLVA